MKTYCVIQADSTSYLLQCVSIFEVDSKFYMHEAAIRVALAAERPFTIYYGKGGYRDTRFPNHIPKPVAGKMYTRKRVV